MNKAAYNGQPASFAQFNTIPEDRDTFPVQPTINAAEFTDNELSYGSSPASRATETTGSVHTPTSDLASLPPGTNYSAYHYQQQQQQEAVLAARMLVTPPLSAPSPPDDSDLLQLTSPDFQPGVYAVDPIVTPISWYSPGPQQFTWHASGNLQSHSMVTQVDKEPVRTEREVDSMLQFDDNNEDDQGMVQTPPAPVEQSRAMEADKPHEPYAQILHRAMMQAPGHRMTLSELYQWVYANTDKAKRGGKGWQNSIRHNLSMNAAFVKSECPGDTDEGKKNSEWVLADWAVRDGVQSTTRYRKGNPSRRNGSSAHHRPHGNNLSRASPSRKGSVSKNRHVGMRQSVLNRATNGELLSRHIDTFHGPTDHRIFNYQYPPVSHADWTGGPVHPSPAIAGPSYDLGTYTYSNPQHGLPVGNFPQRERVPTLYPSPELYGSYSGPATHAAGYHQRLAPLPRYDGLFHHPEEQIERQQYLGWEQASNENTFA
ncbi:hypothetical protein NUW58_g7056 [Xylaria curta]|uniref:Uncharacterized protein n=1 Tax=Xylaria curta TaxID=42375 RepID=A0ACC1NMH5_9PEZI|nr:hypothetical protein NUW58_g7056 [Xylaria curta]